MSGSSNKMQKETTNTNNRPGSPSDQVTHVEPNDPGTLDIHQDDFVFVSHVSLQSPKTPIQSPAAKFGMPPPLDLSAQPESCAEIVIQLATDHHESRGLQDNPAWLARINATLTQVSADVDAEDMTNIDRNSIDINDRNYVKQVDKLNATTKNIGAKSIQTQNATQIEEPSESELATTQLQNSRRDLERLVRSLVVYGETYDASTRVVLRTYARLQGLTLQDLVNAEELECARVLNALPDDWFITQDNHSGSLSEQDEGALPLVVGGPHVDSLNAVAQVTRERSNTMKQRSWSKWACVGSAATAGALALGFSGGTAAPLVGSSLGSVALASGLSAELAALLASTANGSWLTYVFGMAGASLASQRTMRRLGGLRDFEFVVIAPCVLHSIHDVNNDKSENDTDKLAADNNNNNKNNKNSNNIKEMKKKKKKKKSNNSNGNNSNNDDNNRIRVTDTTNLPNSTPKHAEEQTHSDETMPTHEASSATDDDWVHTEMEDVLCPAQLPPRSRLSLVIAISGWLEDAAGVTDPWKWMADEPLLRSTDVLALRWAQKELVDLGTVVKRVVSTEIASQVAGVFLRQTALRGMMAALTWPAAIVKASEVIDNAWSLTKSKADQAGRVLADLLASRVHGAGPLTLVSFAWGARVVFRCLCRLAELAREDPSLRTIVEDCYMYGCPVRAAPEEWEMVRWVVAGRLVNGFSRRDWILGLCYGNEPTALLRRDARIAGLYGACTAGICDVDLSASIQSLLDYPYAMGALLRRNGFPYTPDVHEANSMGMSSTTLG